MVKIFSPNTWQMILFLNPLDALIPTMPFSFFCRTWGPGRLRCLGISLGRILGGPSIEPFGGGAHGGRPGQRVEEQGTWASRTQKHSEAGYGWPVDRGAWTAKTVKRSRQQPAHPQYANYWAPLTRKRHTMPHSAQPQHTNYWAPRTRKRHQQEHRPQRPTESSNPTQHAKGRTGDCPGPRKGTTTRRNVTQGGLARGLYRPPPPIESPPTPAGGPARHPALGPAICPAGAEMVRGREWRADACLWAVTRPRVRGR